MEKEKKKKKVSSRASQEFRINLNNLLSIPCKKANFVIRFSPPDSEDEDDEDVSATQDEDNSQLVTIDLHRNHQSKTRRSEKKRRNIVEESPPPPPPPLPEDVLGLILMRLRAKDLARYRYVCKSWYCLLTSRDFTRRHLDMAKRRPCRPTVLLSPHAERDRGKWTEVEIYSYVMGTLETHLLLQKDLMMSTTTSSSAPSDRSLSSLISIKHCDGLVLLISRTEIHVCNPVTGEFRTLPPGNPNHACLPAYERVHHWDSDEYFTRIRPVSWEEDYARALADKQGVGIGFDPISKEYIVIRYFYRDYHLAKRIWDLGCEIFNLGNTNTSWKAVAKDPHYPIKGSPVFHDGGVVTWKIDSELHCWSTEEAFLSLSLKDYKFWVNSPPASFFSTGSRRYTCNLDAKVTLMEGDDGYLCLLHKHWRGYMDLWVLEKGYSETNYEWSWRYKINPFVLLSHPIPIGMHQGEVLIKTDRGIACFDPETDSVREMVDVEPWGTYFTGISWRASYIPSVFVESLVTVGVERKN